MKEDEPMVELIGDTYDLDSLRWWSTQSNSPLYSVVKKDDKYWLKSPRFGLRADHDSVHAEAKELIPIIKGSAKVRGMDMQSIDVGRVVIGNTSITYPTGEGGPPTYSLLWKENGIFCLKVSDKVSKIGRSLSPIFAFMENKTAELDVIMKKGLELDNYLHQLEKCVDDSYLHQTFSYFADAPNWFNLYNTYEMIKFDTDKTLKDNKFVDKNEWKITRLWAEPDEMRRFTRSANDPRAEGGGRHSFAYHENKKARKRENSNKPDAWWNEKDDKRERKRRNNPSTSQLMSLHEADVLMTRIFRGWCKHKANQCAIKTDIFYAELFARSIMAFISSSSNHSSPKKSDPPSVSKQNNKPSTTSRSERDTFTL